MFCNTQRTVHMFSFSTVKRHYLIIRANRDVNKLTSRFDYNATSGQRRLRAEAGFVTIKRARVLLSRLAGAITFSQQC